jgi:hypothetical protein
VVAQLLAAGANVHADNECALKWAVEFNHEAVAARLLAAGAHVSIHLIRIAQERGHSGVEALLRQAAASAQKPASSSAVRWTHEELDELAHHARIAPAGTSRRAIARSVVAGGLLPSRTLAAIEAQLPRTT